MRPKGMVVLAERACSIGKGLPTDQEAGEFGETIDSSWRRSRNARGKMSVEQKQ